MTHIFNCHTRINLFFICFFKIVIKSNISSVIFCFYMKSKCLLGLKILILKVDSSLIHTPVLMILMVFNDTYVLSKLI